jgi:hypothetical protein
MQKRLTNEEEKKECYKLEFRYWCALFPELKRICVSFLTLQEIQSFDSAHSNRIDVAVLLQFFKCHITNSYEFLNVESLLWATKKLPKISKPRLLLPESVRKRLITFHYICQARGLEHVMRLLIPGIVDSKSINQQDTLEMTGLHYACREGLLHNVKLLVGKNAGINIRDVYGRTPVFLACLRQHDDVYDFLVHEAKADLSIASYGGQSIEDLLLERESSSINANTPSHWEKVTVTVLAITFFYFYYKKGWELMQDLFRK